MKPLLKDFLRGLAKHKGKFISVFFIILVGTAVFSGLRSSEGDMLLSADSYYDRTHLMDLRVVGTLGITQQDIDDLNALDVVDIAEGVHSLDVLCSGEDKKAVKLMSLSNDVNIPTLTSGRLPQTSDECVLDSFLQDKGNYKLGDTIAFVDGDGSSETLNTQLSQTQFTVVGFCNLPQYMDLNRGTGNVGSGEIDGFVLVPDSVFTVAAFTEARILLSDAIPLDCFSQDYDVLCQQATQQIEVLAQTACQRRYDEILAQFGGFLPPFVQLEVPEWYIVGRETVVSCVNFENDAQRIGNLGKLLPIIFFLVAALVSLTCMTRLVEEERGQIGILKALGCQNSTVLLRYLIYALIPTLTGSLVGVLAGEKIFPIAIMKTYALLYEGLDTFLLPYNWTEGLIAVFAGVLCTGLAAVFASYSLAHAKPAQIMRPQSPKPGKRVLAERIPFLWKRLSFNQKTTVRNMFRYKKRLFMTVIGVAGCMGLVLVGLGLHDSITVVADKQFEELTHYQATVSLSDSLSEQQRSQLIEDITQTQGVDVLAVYQKAVEVQGKDSTQTVTVVVPQSLQSIKEYFTFRRRTNGKSLEYSSSGVMLSEKTAKTLGVSVGDTVTFQDNSQRVTVKVDAVFENYIGHYMFFSPTLYSDIFGGEANYNQLLLRYSDTSDEFQMQLGTALLSKNNVNGVAFVSTTVEWADETLKSLNSIVLIVLAAAALLALVVLYNLNSINIAERKRELATLKVLGFYDSEVAANVFRENVILTVIGIVFGIGLGVILHSYVIQSIEVDLIMFSRNIIWSSYLLGAAITLAFSAIINLVMYPALKKIDMIESLKSVE